MFRRQTVTTNCLTTPDGTWIVGAHPRTHRCTMASMVYLELCQRSASVRAGWRCRAVRFYLPILLCQAGLLLPLCGQGFFDVRFDKSEYVVMPASHTAVKIELGSAIPEGLFSYGVRLVYDSILGRMVNEDDIFVPPPIDYNGAQGPGAIRAVGGGFAAVKGTVDALSIPAVYYAGTELVTFNVAALIPGDYTLSLELYRTLGPTESVFVSGSGVVLDSQLRFGTAVLHVVPEPASVFLVGSGLLGMLLLRRSRDRSADRE